MAEFRAGTKNAHTVYLQLGREPDTAPEPQGDPFWLVVMEPEHRDLVVTLLNRGLERNARATQLLVDLLAHHGLSTKDYPVPEAIPRSHDQ